MFTERIRLGAGESFSQEWDGFIERPDGRLRKPTIWKTAEGKEKCANYYYLRSSCAVCNKPTLVAVENAKKSKSSVCSQACKSKNRSVPDGAKKFKRGKDGDHVMVKMSSHPNANKDGYVAEHRLVMEQHLGRLLGRNEQVHHVNLLKDDNGIKNLVLFKTASEHFKSHGSLNECVAELMKRGNIKFNRKTNRYEVA